jgi:endonuclease I
MRIKNLKYFLSFPVYFLYTFILAAQPAGYYSSAEGLSGIQLQQALHDIIDNQTVQTYSSLWIHFQSTDKNPDGKVWDMYSDVPGGSPAYLYIFGDNQCGNYTKEGDCYNREHSFPKSWFGGEVEPMYTDLFHIYPTDGFVNGKRDNFPFGEVAAYTWISTNGSKLGPSSTQGYSGIVFEPVDEYKGDFARTYFYMATRYYGEDSGWPGSDMVTGSQPKSWALQMLIKWDQDDPVSQKEKDRNEAVYLIQGNRNPFIDNPSFTTLIWDSQTGISDIHPGNCIRVWPVPTREKLTIELPDHFSDSYEIKIINISGKVIMDKNVAGHPVTLGLEGIHNGYYLLFVSDGKHFFTSRIVVSR